MLLSIYLYVNAKQIWFWQMYNNDAAKVIFLFQSLYRFIEC